MLVTHGRILLRTLIGVVPVAHSLLKPKSIHIPKSVTVFLYGGFGDTIMKLSSLRNLSADTEIQIIYTKKQAAFVENVIGLGIQKFCIRSVWDIFYIRRSINKSSLFLFHSPLFEIYLLFLCFGFRYGYGYVGNRKRFRGIGFKPDVSVTVDLSASDFGNFCNIASCLDKSEVERFCLKDTHVDLGFESQPFVVININKSKGWPAGRWSQHNFIEVADFVQNELGLAIVLVGSPDETDNVNLFASRLKSRGVVKVENLAGKTTFSELSNLVISSEFVVTCDAFIMHLASHYHKLVFSIFSFSDPKEFVWGNNEYSFNPVFDCMPCVSYATAPVDNAPFVCPYNSRCDSTVSSSELIEKICLQYKTRLV